MNKNLNTKFGKVRIDKEGYYRVATGENKGKALHRLIFEDFYKFEIPDGFVVHHKDGNKLNNCILNLQMLSIKDHVVLHNTGRNFSDEHKNKLSTSHTKKYARVIKNGVRFGKQSYCIVRDKKQIKRSYSIDKLRRWFNKKFPNEELYVD